MNLDHLSHEDYLFLRNEILETCRIIRQSALAGGMDARKVVASVNRHAPEELTRGDLCALLGVAYWILATIDGTVDDES